jgi:hypothetical protein
MKMTVYLGDFRDEFRKAGRENQFSYEGLGILFNWIEQLDDDTGTETELDVIGLCCDFSEDTARDIADNYGFEVLESMDNDDVTEMVRRHLDYNTIVCGEHETDGETYFIYQNY